MAVIYTKKEKKSIIIRSILFVLVIILFGVALTFLILNTRTKSGMKKIDATTTQISRAPSSYSLYYVLEDVEGMKASDMENRVIAAYSEAIDTMLPLLDTSEEYEGINNLYYINNHINEDIVLDPMLYNVLKEVYDIDPRYLYLGNLYEFYNNLRYTPEPLEIQTYDPFVSLEMKALVDEFVNYNGISLKFKSNNTIRLSITDDYVLLQESDHPRYIDLGPLTDAYILDYVKELMVKNYLFNGYIYCSDGYIVDFGNKKKIDYSIPLLVDKKGSYIQKGSIKMASSHSYVIQYGFVDDTLRQYEIKSNDESRIRTSYVNPLDGDTTVKDKSYITYGNCTLVDNVFKMYNYLYNDIVDDYYIRVDKDYKVYSNDTTFKIDPYEVIYE